MNAGVPELRSAYRVAELLIPRELTWRIVGRPLYESIMDRRLVWFGVATLDQAEIVNIGPYDTPVYAIDALIHRCSPGRDGRDKPQFHGSPGLKLSYRYHTDDEAGRAAVREQIRKIIIDDPSADRLFPPSIQAGLAIRDMWPTRYPSPPGLLRSPRWDED